MNRSIFFSLIMSDVFNANLPPPGTDIMVTEIDSDTMVTEIDSDTMITEAP